MDEDPVARTRRALAEGDADLALSFAEKAVEADPKDPEAWMAKGDAHGKLCDAVEARRCWTKAYGLFRAEAPGRRSCKARLDRPDRYVSAPVRRFVVRSEKLPRVSQPSVEILIDGRRRMEFKAGETRSADISEGSHSMVLKVGRNERTFDLRVSGSDVEVYMRTVKKENRWDIRISSRKPLSPPPHRGAMRDEVLTAAARRSLFLSPEALEIMDSNGFSLELANAVLDALSKDRMFVTKKDVLDFLNGDARIVEPLKEEVPKNNRRRSSDIQIVPGSDVTGNSTCEGTIADFVTYFRNRFAALKKIVMKRRDFGPSVSIDRAMKLGRDANVIGMVYDVRTTRNGHTMVTLEDETGTCQVLLSKDSPLANELLVTDEVIGVKGRANSRGNMFIAEEILHPDVPKGRVWEPSDSTASVAFISDIHVGSHEFLEPQWKKMIRWLRENSADRGIDYIVLPGDVVDGIGAYPDQEKDLIISDIYEQYDALAEYLKDIPDDIRTVMHPGNHDACRLAEPQPALSAKFAGSFDSNIMMVGNPIDIRIEGRLVTSYHGKSIDDWISNVRGMSYDDPLAVMKAMAQRRHLAPMYGKRNALAPEKRDYLVMEEVPDIFVSGHVHGAGHMDYRGVRMINASTWQTQTDYQRMHNFNPVPGIVPVVHLGTGKVTMLDFMKETRETRFGGTASSPSG